MVEFGDDLEITYVMGGLARSFGDTAALTMRWLEDAAGSGMPVDPRIWDADAPRSSYPACIAYTAVTGAVVAQFSDAQHLNGTDPSVTVNHTTATNLLGSFYVGYRESLVRTDVATAQTRASLLRPPTFDVAP